MMSDPGLVLYVILGLGLLWLISLIVVGCMFIQSWRRDRQEKALRNGTSDESGVATNVLLQAEAAGPGGDEAIVVMVGSQHLGQAVERITELMERAAAGDRHAEKELRFAERYGYRPGQHIVEGVDMEEVEDRIAKWYEEGRPNE